LTRKSNRIRSRLNDIQVDRVEVAHPDVGPANRAFGLNVQGGGNALRGSEYLNTQNGAYKEIETHLSAEDVPAQGCRERVC
jgi:hypothetical protein